MVKIVSNDPTDVISDMIEDDCEERGYYSNYIIRVKADEIEHTIYVEFNGAYGRWEWAYDWWEGEKDVWLLGFCPIDELELPDAILENGKLKLLSKKEGQ